MPVKSPKHLNEYVAYALHVYIPSSLDDIDGLDDAEDWKRAVQKELFFVLL